jgi:hypothetical protein
VALPRNDERPTRKHADRASFLVGVSDGTRTRDIQDHNLTLYQLNYTHHRRQTTTRWSAR